MSNFKQSNIAIISATAFLCTSKLPGSSNFELCLCSLDIQANSTKLVKAPDFSNVPSEYHEFADILSKTKAEVFTPCYPYNLQINLEGAQPSAGPIYSLLASEQKILKKFIEKNLNTGFIQPILSLHGALVLFVKKKDGSLHLCVNFHSLNCISKKRSLSTSDYLQSTKLISWVYSKIDLYHAYHLVFITVSNEWKTAFRTCYGLFEYSVIHFGLTNAPTAFQWFINDIFSNLLGVCVMIYLDNILIYSNNISEHHWHVNKVFKHLHKAGLYTKVEKCKFHSKSVKYLEYILASSGLTISNKKVKIIQDWLEPKKVKDIQFFLYFANFYHWFIFNHSDIVIPLTCLTQKNIP